MVQNVDIAVNINFNPINMLERYLDKNIKLAQKSWFTWGDWSFTINGTNSIQDLISLKLMAFFMQQAIWLMKEKNLSSSECIPNSWVIIFLSFLLTLLVRQLNSNHHITPGMLWTGTKKRPMVWQFLLWLWLEFISISRLTCIWRSPKWRSLPFTGTAMTFSFY